MPDTNSLAANLSTLTVSTGSRLHLGLFAFRPPEIRQQDTAVATAAQRMDQRFTLHDHSSGRWFGGIGLMIQDPVTSLRFVPAPSFAVQGDLTRRVPTFVQRWLEFQRGNLQDGPDGYDRDWVRFVAGDLAQLPVRIQVQQAAPQHSGLGAGTQLALAVGYGLQRFFGLPDLDPNALARSVGRGLRSAVGTHGFFRGGMIVDRGKSSEHELGQLDGAFAVPADWRILLVGKRNQAGLHGEGERKAFDRLPDIPRKTTSKLLDLTASEIVPALLAADFAAFSHAIYEYGVTAGQCFQSVQGGAFAGERATEIVKQIRSIGGVGVGQSSWGPSLFCFASDAQHARYLAGRLRAFLREDSETLLITGAKNQGVECQATAAP